MSRINLINLLSWPKGKTYEGERKKMFWSSFTLVKEMEQKKKNIGQHILISDASLSLSQITSLGSVRFVYRNPRCISQPSLRREREKNNEVGKQDVCGKSEGSSSVGWECGHTQREFSPSKKEDLGETQNKG
jgi:hypothetical protein